MNIISEEEQNNKSLPLDVMEQGVVSLKEPLLLSAQRHEDDNKSNKKGTRISSSYNDTDKTTRMILTLYNRILGYLQALAILSFAV